MNEERQQETDALVRRLKHLETQNLFLQNKLQESLKDFQRVENEVDSRDSMIKALQRDNEKLLK